MVGPEQGTYMMSLECVIVSGSKGQKWVSIPKGVGHRSSPEEAASDQSCNNLNKITWYCIMTLSVKYIGTNQY